MSLSLEEALRKAAKSGKLNHLTLVYSPAQEAWMGARKPSPASGYQCEFDRDPANALLKALGQKPDPDYRDDIEELI